MGRKRKTLDPKPCDDCGDLVERLTRIKDSPDGEWMMVCDECWPDHAEDNPDYQYGGLWRAKKRR